MVISAQLSQLMPSGADSIGTCPFPNFYKWMGTGGVPRVEEQQTKNWPNCIPESGCAEGINGLIICPIKYVTFPHKCVQKLHKNVYKLCTKCSHFCTHWCVRSTHPRKCVQKYVQKGYTLMWTCSTHQCVQKCEHFVHNCCESVLPIIKALNKTTVFLLPSVNCFDFPSRKRFCSRLSALLR